VVNNDPCFDRELNTCSDNHYDLENRNRRDGPPGYPWGDGVEGRVAGALYDWVDFDNEDPWYDDAYIDFNSIAEIIEAWEVATFSGFWQNYSGPYKHEGVRALYQNTLDEYNLSPWLDPIPEQTVLQDSDREHLIDLWDYAEDEESEDWQLSYAVEGVTDPRCGISLDDHWVNIAPESGWSGTCWAWFEVNDTLTDYVSSAVVFHVAEITDRIYLPLALK